MRRATRWLIKQKARRHPTRGLRPFVSIWFQVLFTPFLRVLFTFPSRYWFAIGHKGVFSLTGWFRLLPAEFHVLRGTQVRPNALGDFAYRPVTFYGLPFQTVSAIALRRCY